MNRELHNIVMMVQMYKKS